MFIFAGVEFVMYLKYLNTKHSTSKADKVKVTIT